jgi:hypothetical protein
VVLVLREVHAAGGTNPGGRSQVRSVVGLFFIILPFLVS